MHRLGRKIIFWQGLTLGAYLGTATISANWANELQNGNSPLIATQEREKMRTGEREWDSEQKPNGKQFPLTLSLSLMERVYPLL